jgi:hypothetical protein
MIHMSHRKPAVDNADLSWVLLLVLVATVLAACGYLLVFMVVREMLALNVDLAD